MSFEPGRVKDFVVLQQQEWIGEQMRQGKVEGSRMLVKEEAQMRLEVVEEQFQVRMQLKVRVQV